MADRADLINQLAASMGAGHYVQTRYEESRFDSDTGTLYCNGMSITSSTAHQAIKHFENMYNKCDMTDPSSRQMGLIYQCAIQSIKMMQDPKVIALLKTEISNV